MKKFCGDCGVSLNENSQFCPSCGAKTLQSNPVNESSPNPPTKQQENTSTVLSTEKAPKKDKPKAKEIPNVNPVMVNNIIADASAGEISFVNSLNPFGKSLTVLSPVKCIIDGFQRIIRNLKTVFQDKKRLISALVLGVIWIVLMLLPKLGFNPLPVKILSALTFAQGGFTNDILRAFGGIVGKGIFATFFLSLFSGRNALKGYGKGFKMLFSSLKSKNPSELASLIVSIGLGLILFNFISGLATIWNSMAGIAAFLLMLRSLGRESGFFRSLAASLTAKKVNGAKAIDPSLLNRITSGMAIGLFLSVALCNIPFVYLPYCVGAAAILAGIILKIVSRGNKKQVAASLLLLAYALTLLFPLAASAGKNDDEWAGTWTLKEVIIDDKSDGLSAYYADNPNDLTVEKVKITDSSYEHEFRYTGEEYISDIVELEDGEYVPIHYYAGEFFKTKITFDKPPKYLRENQELELQVNFDVQDSYIEYFDYTNYLMYGWMNVYEGKEISKNVRVGARITNAQLDVDEKTTTKQMKVSGFVPYGLTNGEIMGIELIVGFNTYSHDYKNIAHTNEEDDMTTAHIYYLYEWKYGVNNMVLNTDASEGPGETDFSVPAAIVISALGLMTTLGAAGASAAGSDTADEKGSTYKMSLYKDFGNAIRYNAPAVPVYARMVEITPEGTEINRTDLTARIEIFPGTSFVKVRDQQISGEYMGAFVEAESALNTGNPEEGVVCFKFTGEGGSFQNNVTFRLVGDPYIEYMSKHNNQLYVLAGSGREFMLPCIPKDFMATPTVQLQTTGNDFIDLRLEAGKKNNYQIIATDKASKPENLEKLFETFRVELTAQSDQNEYVRSAIEVIVCYEGLIPEWHGRDKEIHARYINREKKEMANTPIGFSIGVWNDPEQILDVKPAGEVEISVDDKKELYKTIGISWEIDSESASDRVTNYLFTAKKPFPSENPADIDLTVKAGELTYQTTMKLMPDLVQYSHDLKQEYENCLYIIETYMEGELREKRLKQCKQTWGKFGIEDYQAYRKQVWKSAENQILQKRDSYLSSAAYADTAIVALEFAKNIGDIALDMALAPIGGPFASILIGQAKDSILEIVELYSNDKLTFEGFKEFFNNRLTQMIGMIDNFFDPPEPDDPNFKKKAAIWFSCYFIYRCWYHITYDQDDSGNPAGVVSGVKAAVQDMTVKAVMVAFMNDALDKAKANSSAAKLVNKTGYSKDADSELGKKAVSTAAELWDLTATSVIGFIKSLLGGGGTPA